MYINTDVLHVYFTQTYGNFILHFFRSVSTPQTSLKCVTRVSSVFVVAGCPE